MAVTGFDAGEADPRSLLTESPRALLDTTSAEESREDDVDIRQEQSSREKSRELIAYELKTDSRQGYISSVNERSSRGNSWFIPSSSNA